MRECGEVSRKQDAMEIAGRNGGDTTAAAWLVGEKSLGGREAQFR